MGRKSSLYASLAVIALLMSCAPADRYRGDYYYQDKQGNNVPASLPLAQPRGVNAVVMDDRLSALVGQAQSMEQQMRDLAVRLTKLQDDIRAHQATVDSRVAQNLIQAEAKGKPENLLPVKTAMETKPKIVSMAQRAKPKSKSQTVARPKAKGVYNVRYGVHRDKTRLVFDINGSAKNTMNYDAEAGIVTINLPNTAWNAASSKTYNKPQILGYEAKSSGNGGTIIAMAVQKTSNVKTSILSKPNRLVIDLMK